MTDDVCTQTVPDWMIRHIQDARELFGIGGADWHVTVLLSDRPGGHDDCDGFISCDPVYQNANIEMAHTVKDDETGRAEIYHEVLHAALENVARVADAAIGELPKRQRRIYRKLYRDAVENFVQTMSRSLVSRLARSGNDDNKPE